MSFLDQVQKPIPQAPVITIVGFAGGGKSSLAGRFNKPIFIQAENATSVFEDWPTDTQPSFFPQLPSPNAKRNIKTSDVLLGHLRDLLLQEHDFKTVVIDTITALNTLFEQEVIEFDNNGASNIGEAAGGFNKGYLIVASNHERKDFLQKLSKDDKVRLSDWEAEFVADNAQRQHFSERQIEIIDALIERYRDLIKW